jgi:hypothetical protein
VSGTVTLDGAPLPDAYLSLGHKDPTLKDRYSGKTDASGRFNMGSLEQPGGGVPAGDYTLSITTAYSPLADEFHPAPPEKIPAPHATGIDFEVPAGGTTEANFDLKSK